MKKNCIAIIMFFAIALAISGTFQCQAHAADVIRVAYPIQSGLTEIDAYGNYNGYTYEYLRKISQFTGWEYEFVQVSGDINESLTFMLDELEAGNLDLIGAINYNSETSAVYDFPKESYGSAYSTLSVLESNTKINEANYMSAGLLRVAVWKGTRRIKELKNFCLSNKLNIELVECEDDDAQFKALVDGRADTMLGVDISQHPGTRSIARFSGVPYYFATTKGNTQIISQLNEAITRINETDPYFQSQLYEKYFSSALSQPTFSDDEKAFIASAKPISVAIASVAAPFQYRANDGNYVGMSISLLDAISQKTGLKFEISPVNTTLKDCLTNFETDIVCGVPYEYDFADRYGIMLTNAFVATDVTSFSRRSANGSVSDFAGKKLALPRGATILKGVDYRNVVFYDDIEQCINAVNNGDADFGYGNSYSVAYYLAHDMLPNVVTMPLPGYEKAYCFGVAKPADMMLLTILNKTIRSFSEDEIYACMLRELSQINRDLTLTDYISSNPFESMLLLGLLLAAFAAVIIIFIYNKQRHHVLQTQLDEKHYRNHLLSSISRNTDSVVCIYDIASARLEYIFENCRKILGIEPQELDKHLQMFFDTEKDVLRRLQNGELREQFVFTETMHNQDKNQDMWLRISIFPFDMDGTKKSVIAFFDMTKEKAMQEILNDALTAANQANHAKTRFLSNVSHEMRTPLSAIIGLNDIAAENLDDKDRVADCVAKIKISSEYLLWIINDVLDMAKISEGKLILSEKLFDPRAMLMAIDTIYRPLAEQHDVMMTLCIDEQLPAVIKGDELRIQQILVNLVSNAIKYNRAGGTAELSVKVEKAGADEKLSFIVRDTGVGIRAENIERIFNVFEREERAKSGGTGLGLSISHELAALMGGELTVSSVPEKGSSFKLTIALVRAGPLDKKPDAGTALSIEPDLSGKRLLIAEDSGINAVIVRNMLESRNALTELAVNGQVCFEMFERSPEGYYDAILMDIRMPIMDGYEATGKIRLLNRADAARIPIIALSANAFSDDVKASLNVGMNAHCSKPIDKSELLRTLSQYI